MRKLLLGGLFLIMGVAGASAQPYWGGGYGGYYGPRPGYGFYGPRPGYGYYGPRRGYYGRRCWIRPGFYGPVRVCR